jgi:Ca2+-binding EF-hand superfamily protein
MLKERTAATVEQIWTAFDEDKSGYLDATELSALLKEMLQTQQATQVEVVMEQTGVVIGETVATLCSMDESLDDVDTFKIQRIIKELVDGVKVPLAESLDRVYEELLQNVEQLSTALLAALDIDHNGKIELKELLGSFHEAIEAVVQTEKRVSQVD